MAEFSEFDSHAIPRVVSILSTILEKLTKHNDSVIDDDDHHHQSISSSSSSHQLVCSSFDGLTKPCISVRSYFERIFQYANCSSSCYVVAYIYLDRFVQRNTRINVNSFNIHRLLITSVLTAVKFMEDIYYNNAYYAKVGGISLIEMNYLEVDFLFGVGFELNVTPHIFNSYCSILQREMYLESPPHPARLHCCLTDDESNNCQQQRQLAV